MICRDTNRPFRRLCNVFHAKRRGREASSAAASGPAQPADDFINCLTAHGMDTHLTVLLFSYSESIFKQTLIQFIDSMFLCSEVWLL